MRVGIAGYGLAGRVFHAPLLKGCGYEVASILTSNPERIAQAKNDFPASELFADLDAFLDSGLDLVVIASSNVAHLPQARAALERHIPTVVDKPMGRTVAEVKEMIELSEKKKTLLTTFFNRRWDSDSLTIKKLLATGELGTPFRFDGRFERFRPERNLASWRENLSPEDGGGLLLDLQSHLISTALDYFGPAQLVSASVRSIRGGADDDVTVVLKHESGVDSYLAASAVSGAPGPRVRLLGSKGALVINQLDPQEDALRSGEIPYGGEWEKPMTSEALIHKGEEVIAVDSVSGNYAAFYTLVKAAIESGSPAPVSLADALRVAEIIEEARAISVR
jgi:scyllo-inositol 2-dehydrogenase (NADP+)